MGRTKYCSRECFNKAHSEKMKKNWSNPDFRARLTQAINQVKNRISEASRKCWQDPMFREKVLKNRKPPRSWLKGKHVSEEMKLKLSQANKGKHLSPKTEFKKGHEPWWKKLGVKNLLCLPQVNAKHRENLRRRWKDPQYVAKQMKARGVKPNKKERILDSMLQKEFPNEWKYVGDGSFIIEGLCPDWVNANGKKKVIDLFGCFYHGCPIHYPQAKVKERFREDVRRAVFQKYGYNLLVVWEHELEDKSALIDKLREFTYA
jgi:G:T-mismatch repair DNA endonuclease (very short patch repair protein)